MNEQEPIYVDADEEITAVIDKLKESPGSTVLFVIPKGASLLQSIVNLKLLKKEADNRGKSVAFVTQDQVGRNLAMQVGIPVYQDAEMKEVVPSPPRPERPTADEVVELDLSDQEKKMAGVSVHHYQTDTSRESRQSIKPPALETIPGRSKKRIAAGLLIFLGAVAGSLVFYPKTTIVLGVLSEPFSSSIELTLDKNVTEANKNSSLLPGTELSIEKDKVSTAQATGKRTVGEKAKGSVTIYNCYQSVPLSLPRGTVVFRQNLHFTTTADVTIPAATIYGTCTTAGQASVSIEASTVGSDYNLTGNTTFCVTNYTCTGGTYVNANNSSALTGGSSREITYLRQEDIDKAAEQAKGDLIAEATEDIRNKAQELNLRVLDAALDSEVTGKTSDKESGTETNDSQVTTTVRVRTLAFREQDYRQLIVDLLALRLDEDKRLILSAEDEISTSIVEANWEEGYIKIKGDVKTHVAEVLDEGEVKKMALNKSVGEASRSLNSLPSVVEVTVTSVPRFLNRTALFTRNIVVKEVAK